MVYNFDKIRTDVYSRKTSFNLVGKFWAKFCQAHDEVPMRMFSDEGDVNEYWLTLDDIMTKTDGDLDETNLVNYLLQPQFQDFDETELAQLTYVSPWSELNSTVIRGFSDNEGLVAVKLGELINSFHNDDMYKLRQFDVINTKVVSLLDKIVKAHRLYEPIELAFIDDIYNPVFLSGRHRANAICCLFSYIENWEELEIYVKLHKFNTCAELAAHIESRNGSRAMSSQERTNLWFATQGYDISESDTIFEACKKGVAVLPKVMNAYFVTALDAEKDKLSITETTCGLMGQKVASYVKTLLPANLRKFLKDPESAKAIADTCLDTIVENWDELRRLCEIKQVDKNGETVVSYNVSRNLNKIAKPVAIEVVHAFKDSLENRQNELEAKREKARAAKLEKSKASKQDRLRASIELLKSEGLISEDQLNSFINPATASV